MNAIGLVKARVGGNAVKKKRIKQRVMFFSQPRIKAIKPCHIVRTHIGWGFHRQDENWQLPFPRFQHDPIEGHFRLRRIKSAQSVIGTQPDDEATNLVRQRPIQPRKPIGGGVTGNPGINDSQIGIAGLERQLQFGRKGVLGRKPKPGGKAVAEHQKRNRLGNSKLN